MNNIVPNRFPTRDPRNVRIAFIGDVPGEQDEAGGVPFSGFAGQLLGNALSSVGLSREEVFLGNVCRVRPVGGEFSALEWTGAEVQQGVEALLRDLAVYRPNLVVTLGAAPLHLFRHGNVAPKRGKMGYTWPSSVAKWRGSLFLGHESLSTIPLNGTPSGGGPVTKNAPEFGGIVGLSTVGCGATSIAVDSNQSPCPGPAVAVLHSSLTLTSNQSLTEVGANPSLDGENAGRGSLPQAPTLVTGDLPTLPPVPKHPTKRDPHSTGGTFQWGEQGQRPGTVSAAVPCPATDGMTTECISGVPSGFFHGVVGEGSLSAPTRYKCLATYHPSFVLRAWSKWFDLRQDVRRAREEGGTSELVLPDYEVSYGPVEG